MDAPRTTRVVGIFTPASAGVDLADLIREAEEYHDAGADVVDLDTTPGGPFHGVDEDTIALLTRGLTELDVPVSVSTTSAPLAATAIGHGARWVADPSGMTADSQMRAVAAASTAGWIIGPWSRPERERSALDPADAYTDGLVRNVAALLDAGVRSDRIVLDIGAGATPGDPSPWRMLNHLDRVAALGYPILINGRDEVLAAMCAEDADERLSDAAVGLAVLAAGFGAWGIRTRCAPRAAGVVQRILTPQQRA